jgi:TonB-dependent receptor
MVTKMNFRSISQLFFLLMLICIHSSLTAQSGKIRGKVSDASTGDPLPGSNLIFKELSIGGAADFNGEYMIFAVPAGRHILSVSYLGYESKELDVIITENRTFELNIKLEPLVLEGEEVEVTAQASAQQQAINQQLTSRTIKNIVSKKQIQELPEANAAEAVGRLPGVSLVRSGGEGNKLVIRGMAPKYSQIQIDGVTMAATGDQDRSVDLSMISPYMLEGIELTKSVMANQEATATGGIVNFRIRKAPDEMTLNAVAQGGYNGLRDTYNDYKLSVGGSNRFFSRSLGLYAQFDYEKANRGSQQLGGVSFSQENLEAPVRTNSIQLMDIFRDVERIGGTAVMDFSSPQFEIKLSNFFSRINREETRYTNSYAFSQNGFSLSYDDTPERSLTVLTNSLNIDYKWKDFEFNSVLSHSYSNNVLPARITSTNRNSPTNPFSSNRTSNYNVNLDPETIPDSLAIPLSSIADFMHLGDTYHEESETNERDLSAELNLAYYLRIADQINIKLNLGGKYKYKTKSYDQMTLEMSGQAYRNLVMENFENELSNRTRTTWLEDDQKILLIDFLDSDYGSNNLFDGKYEFSQIFDKEMFRKIHDLGMETYDPSDRTRDYWTLVFQNFIETTYNDYEGDENYYALYIMPEINIAGNLSVVPGLRYESNRTEYTGYRGNRLGVLQNYLPTPVDTVTKVRNNEFFLPMIQIFYEPAAWLTLKAGYTHTLQRPDYNNIMPGWVITNQGQINNLSNFRLKPELSRNWDLQLSFHSDKIGLFSAGVFHKKITDMIFWTCLLYTSPSPRDRQKSRMPSSA